MQTPEYLTKIAQAENTPELRTYWERKFKALFENNVFTLHPKTVELMEQSAHLQKPTTPYGFIVIKNLTTSAGELDEVLLQNTIDTAVRLLDNILECVEGNQQAITKMKQYRKIALGIHSYEDYIKNHSAQSIGIDTIGTLLSNGAYRASESIAEEKGACQAWGSINKIIRPKTFEYWYHPDTSKIIDALSLSNEYTQETIATSGYEIIPRRNSHILAYPQTQEWDIWTDRIIDYTQKQNIEEFSEPSTLSPEIHSSSTQETTHENDHNQEKEEDIAALKTVDAQHITDDIQQNFIANSTEKPVTHELNTQTRLSTVLNLQPTNNTISEIDESPLDLINEHEIVSHDTMIVQESPHNTLLETPKNNQIATISVPDNVQEVNSTISETQDYHDTTHTENTSRLSKNSKQENLQTQFQIGELVLITDKFSPFYNQTAQVVDSFSVESTQLYTLKSTIDEVNKTRWRSQQLTSVDLFELLDKINLPFNNASETDQRNTTQLVLQAFVVNEENNTVLVTKNQQGLTHLPEITLPINTIPEQVFGLMFKEQYGLDLKIVREIGSAVEFATQSTPFKTILAFAATLENSSILDTISKTSPPTDYEWISFRDAQFGLSPATRVICNKFNRLKTLFNQQPHMFNFQSTRNNNTMPTQEPLNTSQSMNTDDTNTTTNSALSQYIVKLENIIQSDVFGSVTLRFEYKNKLPFLHSISGDNLSEEMQFFANTIMHFANHLLTLNQSPLDISEFFTHINESGTAIPMNDILILIADSIKNIPSTLP